MLSRGIHFASFYNCSIGFWNCFDSEVLFRFQFYILLLKKMCMAYEHCQSIEEDTPNNNVSMVENTYLFTEIVYLQLAERINAES